MKHRMPTVRGMGMPLVLLGLLAGSQAVHADTRPGGEVTGLTLTLGGGAIVLPRYSGADSYRGRPTPFIDLRYRDKVFFNPFSGLGWNAIRVGELRVGPKLQYSGGRRGTGALSGARSVRGGAAAGAFVNYRVGDLWLDADVLYPMTGDVDGYRATAGVSIERRLLPRLLLSAGPSLVWQSSSFADANYGLDDRDAAATGLQPYRAGSGLTEVRLQARLTYLFENRWSLTAVGGAGRLVNDAKDSPIVDDVGDANQGYLGLVLAYTFRRMQ